MKLVSEFATKFVPRAGPKPVNDEKIKVKGVKLNNNTLSDISALPEALSTVIADINEITWLDLSFNNISKIPEVSHSFSLFSFSTYLFENPCFTCKSFSKSHKVMHLP